MDMPTPDGLRLALHTGDCGTLARIAKALDCSPASFFEQPTAGHPNDASLLMQTWLAIKSPKGRDVVFAFAREVLRSEKR